MGYLIWNGMVWSRLCIHDFDHDLIRKVHSLNERINHELIENKREIFMQCTPIDTKCTRTIGLRKVVCEIDKLYQLQTGDYSVYENRELPHTYGFGGQITECTLLIHSKTRTIQKLFRHQRWRRSIPVRIQNLSKMRTFQDVMSYIPADVTEFIVGSFLASLENSHVIHGNQRPPVITIETELFKQLGFLDSDFPSA